MVMPRSLFIFRQDLRLSDNPGLTEAAAQGPFLAAYIDDPAFALGGASKWWLHQSLTQLNQSLDGKLNFYQGHTAKIVQDICARYDVRSVYWNRCYEPERIHQDTSLKADLHKKGIACQSFNASLLWEPMSVLKSDGKPYKVFTPFYRKGCMEVRPPRPPLPKPSVEQAVKDTGGACRIGDLHLTDPIAWHHKLPSFWKVGENAAQECFDTFLQKGLDGYKEGRNFPSKSNVSRLSPHLHFGEISPHQLYNAIQSTNIDTDCFLSELGWREFSYHLLYHFPSFPKENFQKKFDGFPWQKSPVHLKAWKEGLTGYPLVDAGMRELFETGYMHNRVRMVTASFLVKNLGVDWREGAAWFWDCLLDADLASNSVSWQWVAGSGCDAAPYFRVFNPTLQGEKFDADGSYTRRFVPELKNLPQKYLFRPWESPKQILEEAGVILGNTYPRPIVDFAASRAQALQAFRTLQVLF